MKSNKKLLIFGCGYVAQHLAKIVDCDVIYTSRNIKADLYFDENNYFDISKIKDVTHILISIPPINSTDIVYDIYGKIFENLPFLEWVGYLSATSVYGDKKGAIVDENSDTIPNDVRGENRLFVENLWLSSKLPIHIFRIAGIYGRGRSVVESIINGSARRIYKKDQIFSRIHVDDICQVLNLSMQKSNRGAIYNLADDLPSSQLEVVEYACELLAKPYPEIEFYENDNLSPMLKSFYNSSKRVSNLKIKKELGVNLYYPSYKEGIKKIIQDLKIYC